MVVRPSFAARTSVFAVQERARRAVCPMKIGKGTRAHAVEKGACNSAALLGTACVAGTGNFSRGTIQIIRFAATIKRIVRCAVGVGVCTSAPGSQEAATDKIAGIHAVADPLGEILYAESRVVQGISKFARCRCFQRTLQGSVAF